MGKDYDGPVVFLHPHDEQGRPLGDGTQGVHYPVNDDGEPDTSRPLMRNDANDGWRDVEYGEATHHEIHHVNHVEMVFPDGSTIEVSEDEADAVRKFLDEQRGA